MINDTEQDSVLAKFYIPEIEAIKEKYPVLRTYRAFLEGFIMLQIHNSFGNPISLDESFVLSMNVLLSGMEKYRKLNDKE